MPDQPLNATSVLDAMHYLAKNGASLKVMIESFPEINPVKLVEWMRTNGYARNGL